MNKLHKHTQNDPIQDNTDCATGVSTSKTKRQANPAPGCKGIGNVSYMPRVNTPKNHSNKSLDEVIVAIKSLKYKPVTQLLRDLREKSEKAYKKQKAIVCEAVSFNGTFKLGQPVKNGTFEKSSGLLIVDLDHLEDVHLAKSDLITKPNIVFCFISPSGDGLKLGVRVDASLINNDADFKQAYFQIESLFKTWGYETDPACKDISRKCFLCHDADVFYNPDADIYKLNPFQEIAPKAPPISKEYTPNSNEGDCLESCINTILNAKPGERHAARLNAGNALGHYVASGKLDVKNEDDYINALITASDQIAGNDDDRTREKENKAIKGGYQYGLLHHSEPEAWEYNSDLTLLKNIESIPLPAPDKAVYSIIAKAVQAHPIISYKDTITALEDRMGCKLSGRYKARLKKLLRKQDKATRKYHTVTTDSLPEFDINSDDAASRMLSEWYNAIFVDMRPMGSGKTLFTALLWAYLQMNNKAFGYVAPRVSIIADIANRLDIEHYNEVSPGELFQSLAACVNSAVGREHLLSFFRQVDCIVLDEFKQIVEHIVRGPFNNRSEGYDLLIDIIKTVPVVYVADADMNDQMIKILESAGKPMFKIKGSEREPTRNNKAHHPQNC